MRSHAQICAALLDPGVIAVVRASRTDQVLPLARALLSGGIVAVEVTLTTPQAIEAIHLASLELGSEALIGVGTVLDETTARAAIEAGAEFVVSPILRPALVGVAHSLEKPVMLGACTPTEAQLAFEAGSDFVKLFPADGLGPEFIKAIRAPLPHLRIVPTGGVDLETIGEFFRAGCVAVGAGSSLISKRILETDDWPELTRVARRFVDAARRAKAV